MAGGDISPCNCAFAVVTASFSLQFSVESRRAGCQWLAGCCRKSMILGGCRKQNGSSGSSAVLALAALLSHMKRVLSPNQRCSPPSPASHSCASYKTNATESRAIHVVSFLYFPDTPKCVQYLLSMILYVLHE